MPDTVRTALLFLINTLFDLYLLILVIRLILVFTRANYFDPATQFIIRLTDFIVKPLRRLIPNFRQLECATLLLILIFEMLKFTLIYLVNIGMPNILGLPLLALGDFIKIVLFIFFYAILLQAILSWIQPGSMTQRTLYQFTYPIMRPFQRLIPLINGIDISPIFALITLQLFIILLANPLMAFGMSVASG